MRETAKEKENEEEQGDERWKETRRERLMKKSPPFTQSADVY